MLLMRCSDEMMLLVYIIDKQKSRETSKTDLKNYWCVCVKDCPSMKAKFNCDGFEKYGKYKEPMCGIRRLCVFQGVRESTLQRL